MVGMNIPNKIAKIDAEILKTTKLSKMAETDGGGNHSYWTGYLEGLQFARKIFISLINKKGMKS